MWAHFFSFIAINIGQAYLLFIIDINAKGVIIHYIKQLLESLVLHNFILFLG